MSSDRFAKLQTLLGAFLLLYLITAFTLLTFQPSFALISSAATGRPVIIHLFGLGGVVSGYYLFLMVLLRRHYGENSWERWAWPAILACHIPGVALLVGGFYWLSPVMAYAGGHYLVPGGIALSMVLALRMAFKRAEGATGRWQGLLPTLGLALAGSLGAMMVLDAYRGGYSIYLPSTILVHALAAGFLFVLPTLLLAERLEGMEEEAGPSLAAPALLAGLGVLLVAVGEVVEGRGHWVAYGLGLLGFLAMWLGIPLGRKSADPFQPVRRMPWAAVGALLLFAALRSRHGLPEEGGFTLAFFAITLFFLGLVLPELVGRLLAAQMGVSEGVYPPAEEQVALPVVVHHAANLFGTGLFLGGQMAGMGWLVRAGAAVWLVSLLLLARRLAKLRLGV